jgi:hypothetical protein
MMIYGLSNLMYPCNHLTEISLHYFKFVATEEDVTQGDNRVSLSLIAKASFKCRGLFQSRGD